MHALLATALADIEPLVAGRNWVPPSPATLAEATRLLDLVAPYRPPQVAFEPDGTLVLAWEAAGHGWLTLSVDGGGQLTHGAVIDEEEFTQTEDFGDALPGWAAELLARLMRAGH
jgi:hypothetical protein